jgi:pyruvate dehydrogenase E2 component (dihydrolipoamide acetyltransferase)
MAEVVIMPKLGFDMAEGILIRWIIFEGEPVEKGQVLAEIETDKATVEVEALADGIVHKHLVSEGAITPVGAPIAVIGAPDETIDFDTLLKKLEAPPPDTAPETVVEATPAVVETVPVGELEVGGDGKFPGGVRASPLARKMAQELGLNLTSIQGTGAGGRVVKRDIERVMHEGYVSAGAPEPGILPSLPPGETARVPLTKLRAAIGRRMVAAKQQAPHFYITVDVDAGPVTTLRAEANEMLPEGEKLSVNDFIVKAAARALRDFPNLNASLDGDHIVRHGEVNIGVAVAVDEGLLTVVCHEADRKPLRILSKEIREMVDRTRQGKVRPDDIEGSTFTVSNLGMFGVDHFIAIINPPEAAILAIGGVREEPVFEDGQIVRGLRVQCTLSADHRVTDGAEAARWLQVFKDHLEHPLRFFL